MLITDCVDKESRQFCHLISAQSSSRPRREIDHRGQYDGRRAGEKRGRCDTKRPLREAKYHPDKSAESDRQIKRQEPRPDGRMWAEPAMDQGLVLAVIQRKMQLGRPEVTVLFGHLEYRRELVGGATYARGVIDGILQKDLCAQAVVRRVAAEPRPHSKVAQPGLSQWCRFHVGSALWRRFIS